MNLYIIQFIGKVASFVFVTLLSLIPSYNIGKETYVISSLLTETNTYVYEEEINFETKYTYNQKVPSTYKRIVNEGINGTVYYDKMTNKKLFTKEPISKTIEVGTGKAGVYYGRITGYTAYCEGCSGTVSCNTKIGKNHSLITDGLYYQDDQYGKIRILAAPTKEFPCGTIIHLEGGRTADFYAIVLDRGYAMNKAWSDGSVLIDVAVSSKQEAFSITSGNIKFNVARWGW